jgi:TDG/mug DNA glycosylase family protein
LASGNDSDIERDDYDSDDFWDRISLYRPAMVAFNGKQAAKVALQQVTVNYGLQDMLENRPRTFVLPSTSGAARGYWDISHWQELARLANCR